MLPLACPKIQISIGNTYENVFDRSKYDSVTTCKRVGRHIGLPTICLMRIIRITLDLHLRLYDNKTASEVAVL